MNAALVVLDGWGIGEHPRRDAVKAADTPNFERYARDGAAGRLRAAGEHVGLPANQASNSEVGHLTIGAGTVIKQAYTRVNEAIAADTLQNNAVVGDIIQHVVDHDSTLHFLGLVSKGGVHSDHRHLHALIEIAAETGADAVTHVFTDGRDASPTSGRDFIDQLETKVDEYGTGDPATVIGRYYGMDRNQNWERTKQAYDAIVDASAEHVTSTALEAVEASYERGDTDEFIEPTLVDGGHPVAADDAIFFFNFREDRSRQLVRMLADIEPTWTFETDPPDTNIATITEYDDEFPFPVAFSPVEPEAPLGQVVADTGGTQLRIAESEKYAHVTYFINGGREVKFDGETREIIPSPDVKTYDEQPEMNAGKITDTAIDRIRTEDPELLVLNYANPDMVGHTGDFEAAVTAVEAVDEQLGRLVEATQAMGAHVILTADHGNADDMGTAEEPHTAHTTNPVPFVYCSADGDDGGRSVRDGGTLADIAPTVLELLGVEKPGEMTGKSLLE